MKNEAHAVLLRESFRVVSTAPALILSRGLIY